MNAVKYFYSKEIADTLNIRNIESVKALITTLKQYSIVKSVKSSKEEYVVINDCDEVPGDKLDSSDVSYVFNYVGIVILGNYTIKCYPKYIRSTDEPKKEFKTILRVIQDYNSRNPVMYLNNGLDGSMKNGIALKLYILNEFYQRGLYIKEREVIEDNGEGEIIWEETLESPTIYVNGEVFHVPLKTLLIEDNEDYFTNLHKCILTQISADFIKNGLADIFDINQVFLTSVSLKDFDNTEHILYMLRKEQRSQYVTWKQQLLQALYTYISLDNIKNNNTAFDLYGTNSFHVIWEDVCKVNFGDCLDTKLNALSGGLSPSLLPYKNKKLKDIIEKPIWHNHKLNAYVEAENTFIPDLLGIYYSKNDAKYEFWIFDAKYYYVTYKKKKNSTAIIIEGQPGVEDIAKQYLYELVYRRFVSMQNYILMHNIFLMPTENKSEYIGFASLESLKKLNGSGLEQIEIINLCAEEMYQMYLKKDKTYDILSYLHNIFYHSYDETDITNKSEIKVNTVYDEAGNNSYLDRKVAENNECF